MSVSLSAVGFYFRMQDQKNHEGWEDLPLVALVLFVVGYSAGFASIPYVIMGELFPAR